MTRSIKTTLLFTTLFLAASMLLTAQTHQGEIRGAVIDPTGAVVPGATVTASNNDTGVTLTSVASSVGAYGLLGLQPGTYTLEVRMDGFKTLVMEDLRVDLAAVIGVDLQLEIGSATETIDVIGATPLLQTENTEIRTVIEPDVFVELPLTLDGTWGGGRNAGQFVFLSPGVTSARMGQPMADDMFSSSVNGSQVMADELQLDGISMQIYSHTSAFVYLAVLSPEAIQEASIATSNYSAEYGNSLGAVQRYTIKSGTNEFHGSGYWYLRNEALDASGFFLAEASENKKNEYGFVIGGPIVRNKTFFFANMQWQDWAMGTTESTNSIPTPAMRRGDLSFPGIPPIFDPATTSTDAAGNVTRTPFLNNMVPTARISPASTKAMSFFPDPNFGSGIVNNYTSSNAGRVDKDDFMYKFNHRFNDAHSMSALFNQHKLFILCAGSFPYPLNRCSNQDITGYNPRFSWDWVVSPTVFNHASFGWNFHDQPSFFPSDFNVSGIDWGQELGIPNVGRGPFPKFDMPPYDIGGGGGNGTGFSQFRNVTYIFSDTLSWTKGKHNMKIGGEWRQLEVRHVQASGTLDSFFESPATGNPSATGSTGLPFASFLMGAPARGFRWIQQITPLSFAKYSALYFQDDWKVRPNLTLNLGVRWNLHRGVTAQEDAIGIMDPTRPNPGADGQLGAMIFAGFGEGREGRNRLSDTFYGAFAPRAGLAWKVAQNIVVRAGYGMQFYPTTPFGGGAVRSFSTGWQARVERVSQDGGLTPPYQHDAGFPTDFIPPPFIDPAFNLGGHVDMFHENTPVGSYTQRWSLTTQWSFARNWLLDVGYVASKGTRLQGGILNPNQIDSALLGLGGLLRQPIDDPAVVAAGFTRPYPSFEGTLAQGLRPFPQYASVGTHGPALPHSAPIGNSIYHSLQVKLEKRFSEGFYSISSFTWSKHLTDSDSQWGAFVGRSSRDSFNRRLSRGLALGDIPLRYVHALVYELPFGRGRRFAKGISKAANQLIGGWQLNAIVEYSSGIPIQLSAANALPIFNFKNMPNVISGVNQKANFGGKFDPGAGDRYLNLAAFAEPGNAIGNAPFPLSEVRGFGIVKEHVGVIKTFNITERVQFDFRFEFFNVFNRTHLGNPNGNVSDPVAFGTIGSQANSPRTAQWVFRVKF